MANSTTQIKSVIRESVRTTIRNTLASVIQEVTEEELRMALKEKNFREPLVEMIQSELQLAIKDLSKNGKRPPVLAGSLPEKGEHTGSPLPTMP